MRKGKKIIVFIFVSVLSIFINSIVAFAEELEEPHVCENPEVLKVLMFASIILNIIRIVIPIGLVILSMLDFSKGVSSSNDGDNKKIISRIIKRIISAVLIFVVPWIVKIIIISLGDLTKDVNYTDCLENATEEAIARLQPKYDAWLESQKNSGGNSSGNSSSGDVNFSDEVKVKIKYDDELVDNYAAFIGSEAGGNQVGFEAQLMTGAIFMNNMFLDCGRTPFVTSPEQITKKTMCNTFSYGNMYSTKKCNYTLDSLGFNATQKKQLTVAAKLILSGIYTIPSNINGQGKMKDWGGENGVGRMWGSLTTANGCKADSYNEDGCSQVYSYSKYCAVNGGVSNKDIYGNTVSTNINDYKAIADTLYQKYVVEGKEIF